eukprot:6199519-Pleurochrysis_carterae.AAC.3
MLHGAMRLAEQQRLTRDRRASTCVQRLSGSRLLPCEEEEDVARLGAHVQLPRRLHRVSEVVGHRLVAKEEVHRVGASAAKRNDRRGLTHTLIHTLTHRPASCPPAAAVKPRRCTATLKKVLKKATTRESQLELSKKLSVNGVLPGRDAANATAVSEGVW